MQAYLTDTKTIESSLVPLSFPDDVLDAAAIVLCSNDDTYRTSQLNHLVQFLRSRAISLDLSELRYWESYREIQLLILGFFSGQTIRLVEVPTLDTRIGVKNTEYLSAFAPYHQLGLPSGKKEDTGKLDWSLLPPDEIEEIVKVLQHGAKKYAPDNWKKVEGGRRRYFNAALRHLWAWWKGESKDPESGLSHLAHSVCCMIFLLWMEKNNK